MTQRHAECIYRRSIAVTGTVQGVGFRPFVYGLARRYHLAGWVRNTAVGVLIEVEGTETALAQFQEALRTDVPPLARITEITADDIPPLGDSEFAIRQSDDADETRTNVPPDVATCDACLTDIATPENRRHRYGFTNCTHCGPRFTIISAVPYDRPNTTMRDFAMCPDCRAEYEDPRDRRFHAQPIACPACGPHLCLDGQAGDDTMLLSEAARLLHAGNILAVKGLGGYHLACDARNPAAVAELRMRKGRGDKPFAVMCADLAEAHRAAHLDAEAVLTLTSPERPIVLAPAREGNGIADTVAPGVHTLGMMLPYTPLHTLLLVESPSALVMTSGNLAEEPLVYLDEEAHSRLGHIADHILAHNRPIEVPCDDSVARAFHGEVLISRRARGYVPVPIECMAEMPPILACGGDLKNTFCLTKGRQALLSQHLGDLENVPAQEHHQRMVEHFCRFFAVQPEIVAHDLHPDYHSTRFALGLPACRHIAVQHHHAHIAACLAEHGHDGPVIGLAFDGTGYGTDGAIWGGEFLIADTADFHRAAHLAYVPLPGGEAAIRRPGRMALSYLLHAFGPEANASLVPGLTAGEIDAVTMQVARGFNASLTSSMGRVFDAVSALLGVCTAVTYEGQAAIELEALADPAEDVAYPFEHAGEIVDLMPAIRAIVAELGKGVPIPVIAGRFHATIAEMAVTVCTALRKETNLNTVALSGGVFQNLLLLDKMIVRLRGGGFTVLYHRSVPTNDGCIALGQAVIAARRERG